MSNITPEDLYNQLLSVQGKITNPMPQESPRSKKSNTELVRSLNVLLANTASLYHEAHGFHWNVKGSDFAQYHELFSDIYGFLSDNIDPTAENILKCGFDAPFHMSDFIKLRTIPEANPEDTPQAMAMSLLSGINELCMNLKDSFDIANGLDEQGIGNFIAGYLDEAQKWAWQLRASLGLQRPNTLF